MPIRRRSLLTGAAALSLPAIHTARAAATIKIGVLSDMSGQYAEASGPGDFLAAQMAAEDFMKSHPDLTFEVVQGDMLLKPDVGASIARGWYDQDGVDAMFDIPQPAVAIAVGQVAKEKDKVVIFTASQHPRSDRQILHSQPDLVDLRPVGQCQRHHPGPRRGRR